MPTKKKIATGPKAKLMKKNLAQLKAQAKKLKIKGFSTKKKEALVNSILMAQARNNKGKAKRKTMAERDYTPTGTRKSMKRMAKKRGAPASHVMKNPATTGRVMMSNRYNKWANYETYLFNIYYGEEMQEYVQEMIEYHDAVAEDYRTMGSFLRDYMENFMLENMEVPLNMGFATQIFNAGFEEVDFEELATIYTHEL